MSVINHLTSNNNKLSVHEFFKVCQNAGILRLVKTEEDENYIYIIICGVYRIQKNKKKWKYQFVGVQAKRQEHRDMDSKKFISLQDLFVLV
ncbi:hypothetical protein ACY46W_004159 [Escherichia coli]